jgi:hypothetical protein
VSAVFAANGRLGTHASVAAGVRPALLVCAAIALLGAVTSLGVRRMATVADNAQSSDRLEPEMLDTQPAE